MSHLQSIERACQKANPSGMKIEYKYDVPKCDDCKKPRLAGCAITKWKCIRCGDEQRHGNTNKPRLCNQCAMETCCCSQCGKDMTYRPITLQDILLCLGDDWAMQTGNNQHFSGQFYPKLGYDRIHDGDGLQILRGNTFGLSDMYPNDIPRYDLTKSPYDQLPEVLQFLAENLTK